MGWGRAGATSTSRSVFAGVAEASYLHHCFAYATQQRTPRAATRGSGGRGVGRAAVLIRLSEECRNERVDRVARYIPVGLISGTCVTL